MSDELFDDKLLDILESIETVLKRTAHISTPQDFLKDDDAIVLFDSVLMRLQVIGEMLKSLSAKTNISSKNIKGAIQLREKISHHYIDLDAELIFDICKNHIPSLKEELKSLKNARPL
ncbi:MAG: DUF86 domain-containing protein [Campylobacteraceae bacterium]|nr:DUF86 domain-containing protein [Campylobacteraceae bacterium]